MLFSVRSVPQLPEEEREKFVPLPDTTSVAMALDPRTEPEPPGDPDAGEAAENRP
ncbi:hypothetical protein K1T73_01715 [Roseovarius sp. SCSIO 43702]|uniref:hypothetical protein n=1 Tax=Roseovarius sp. SCSIO 43702 TaxID=2823043 RepID=UPI001C734FD2|nr:hypothetical protein [Roseovarius sp. SCSIO 43702]QYX57158.1 hypothetical protein K1T73_01715 [Roseovarius sp. SCSIO 43702]